MDEDEDGWVDVDGDGDQESGDDEEDDEAEGEAKEDGAADDKPALTKGMSAALGGAGVDSCSRSQSPLARGGAEACARDCIIQGLCPHGTARRCN